MAVTVPWPGSTGSGAAASAACIRIIGTGQSGMTADQYAMMRERVLAFLTTDEDALRGSLWAYTSSELAALRAKRSELERYQEALAAE